MNYFYLLIADETIFISRPKNENIVMLSEHT